MTEAEIVRGLLFPADQQPPGTVGPEVVAFNHPSAGAALASMAMLRMFTLAGDVDDVATSADGRANGFRVVVTCPHFLNQVL